MSEKILEALMQLFAIISRPESNAEERRAVVASYLESQLNKELSDKYVEVFNTEFRKVIEEDAKVTKKEKILARRAVRVLKLCTNLIEELDQSQRIIVLFQLLEFVKSEKVETKGPELAEAKEQEKQFIELIAETFLISENDLKLISNFVSSDKQLDDQSSYLIVNGQKNGIPASKIKHFRRENLEGEIWFIRIQSTNMYFVKFVGKGELTMNGQLLEPMKS